MFGYEPTVYQVAVSCLDDVCRSGLVPIVSMQEPKKDIYVRLTKQCENTGVPVIHSVEDFKAVYEKSDVLMDTIFGKPRHS